MGFLGPDDVIKIDQQVFTPPKSPQIPTGFWDKVKVANQNNLVMGMQPDDFAVMMGRLGGSIVPADSTAGGLAAGVMDMGMMRREQRLKEQDPERRLAEAQTNFYLGQGVEPTAKAPVAGPNAQVNPTSLSMEDMFTRMGLAREAMQGPRANRLTDTQIRGNNAQANLTELRTPGEIRQTNAQADIYESRARVDQATEKTAIDQSSANLAATYAQIEHLNKQNRYYEEEHINQPRASIANSGAGNALGWANLQQRQMEFGEQRLQRVMFQSDKLNQALTNHVDLVAQDTTKQLAKTATARGQASVYAASGSNLIRQGLTHFSKTKMYEEVDGGVSRAVASQSISAGFKYLAEGINSAPDVDSKILATTNLLKEIDYLSTFNPRLAQEIEYYYFGKDAEAIKPYKPESNWFVNHVLKAGKIPFDPWTVRKLHRGKKK